jgi:hypothetical protein
MTPLLTGNGYEQTKVKLANLKGRLAALESRKEQPRHFSEVRRSYLRMIQQYTREVKLYEAAHSPNSRGGQVESATNR